MPHEERSLSSYSLAALESWAATERLPRFRARQLHEAIFKRAAQEFDEITELPAALRSQIQMTHALRSLHVRLHLASKDGAQKVLFGLQDGLTVETVLIRKGTDDSQRNTVCVSSQVGCPAGCTFCATGLNGLARNLTAEEIADQVFYFAHWLRERGDRVTNVVYMGMGEPLLNVRAVRQSIGTLTDPSGFNLGSRRITVSTVGIVPQIQRFGEWAGQVNLAVSLHAPNEQLRRSLVPYNEHFPIHAILAAAREYSSSTRRRVSFEYVLLRGVNDTPNLARELAALLRPLGGMAHVNLIPWNPFREGRFVRSEGPDAERFAQEVQRGGVNATVRYSKGLDISAACGQLREQVSRDTTKTSSAR